MDMEAMGEGEGGEDGDHLSPLVQLMPTFSTEGRTPRWQVPPQTPREANLLEQLDEKDDEMQLASELGINLVERNEELEHQAQLLAQEHRDFETTLENQRARMAEVMEDNKAFEELMGAKDAEVAASKKAVEEANSRLEQQEEAARSTAADAEAAAEGDGADASAEISERETVLIEEIARLKQESEERQLQEVAHANVSVNHCLQSSPRAVHPLLARAWSCANAPPGTTDAALTVCPRFRLCRWSDRASRSKTSSWRPRYNAARRPFSRRRRAKRCARDLAPFPLPLPCGNRCGTHTLQDTNSCRAPGRGAHA